MNINSKLTTPEERKEIKYVGIRRIRLQYLKNSKQLGEWMRRHDSTIDPRMWNLIEPHLPGYTYDGGFPTFTLAGLRQHGIV